MDITKLKKDVFDLSKPIVENLGYELVEVNYDTIEEEKYITIVIYSPNGITFDDCKKVSKALDEPLDELDPTCNESYNLNVSSLGLDRELKTKRDFERFLNQEIEVKVNSNKIVGVLSSIDENSIKLIVKNTHKTIKLNEITKAKPYIKF